MVAGGQCSGSSLSGLQCMRETRMVLDEDPCRRLQLSEETIAWILKLIYSCFILDWGDGFTSVIRLAEELAKVFVHLQEREIRCKAPQRFMRDKRCCKHWQRLIS